MLQFVRAGGGGYVREQEIGLENVHLQSSGAPLTTTLSTNPGFDKEGTNLTTLSWAAAKVVEAGLRIKVPGDYDESVDKMTLWLYAKMGGSTDTATAIDAKAWKASASTTDLDPTQTADLTASYAWVKIDLSSNSLSSNEVLQLALFPEAHANDAVHVLSMVLRYNSCVALYRDDERGAPTDTPA
jgi:hypothetical protein